MQTTRAHHGKLLHARLAATAGEAYARNVLRGISVRFGGSRSHRPAPRGRTALQAPLPAPNAPQAASAPQPSSPTCRSVCVLCCFLLLIAAVRCSKLYCAAFSYVFSACCALSSFANRNLQCLVVSPEFRSLKPSPAVFCCLVLSSFVSCCLLLSLAVSFRLLLSPSSPCCLLETTDPNPWESKRLQGPRTANDILSDWRPTSSNNNLNGGVAGGPHPTKLF